MQKAIVCFNKEMKLGLRKFLHEKINHVSIVVETKPHELVHLTWTGQRIAIEAGSVERTEYIRDIREDDVLVVEHPIKGDWTPCIGPFTCVSMVKRVLGLGPLSMYIVTPHQLYRFLRRQSNGRES